MNENAPLAHRTGNRPLVCSQISLVTSLLQIETFSCSIP